ncbi:SpaA isopeptide-forming pilin-related protein [Listeria seeligeri]|uniref:prealbumin-like fold domain-containing protein n=1 Tax=Listeria seeligeri TaxID=1640 RepID=UPI0022EBDFA5|nr:SpaA isopeptide-forming pilin-related protein [Listeria seeligeri]
MGDYELVEIIAPTNYQLINKPILITIDGTHDGMVEVKILNKKLPKPITIIESGERLPNFGDNNSWVIILFGLGMITTGISIYWSIIRKE